ncbi:MAG: galactose oxidase [Candidatus Lokiarchaeota archaeon]|nr:galactose oxidase [Candidatus Lokiarchaeota archaeon]
MKSKNKKIAISLGISGIIIISIILIVVLIPPSPNTPSKTINIWTWESGYHTTNNNGTYGTKGVASVTNVPGGRYGSAAWTDAEGNFWLFGGSGYDNISGINGYLNDLWKFDGLTWTWVSGNYSRNNNGTYGTKGVASVTNIPGGRYGSAAWTDAEGNLWLFGGSGYDNISGTYGWLNDLWMFNLTDSTWTWVSGNYSCNNNGTYGIKGIPDTANVPGARTGHASWTDTAGNFWLFGGFGYDNESGYIGQLNDLWRFNISDLIWTWMSGNYSRNNNGTYGTKGVAEAANIPGARDGSVSWTDTAGNFWLFGGFGYDNESGTSGRLNDLWRFTVSDSTWTWMSGNYSRNNNGIYGMKGVADASNVPGARGGSAFWTDTAGNFWLLGGNGYDNVSFKSDRLNDLWRFTISDSTWTWMSGNYSCNNNGIYGMKGVADASNVPGARSGSASWTDMTGNLWLFGGYGYDNTSGLAGRLNDLWKYSL